jgi:hypothetical protein
MKRIPTLSPQQNLIVAAAVRAVGRAMGGDRTSTECHCPTPSSISLGALPGPHTGPVFPGLDRGNPLPSSAAGRRDARASGPGSRPSGSRAPLPNRGRLRGCCEGGAEAAGQFLDAVDATVSTVEKTARHMAAKSPSDTDAANSSATSPTLEATESSETVVEAFMKRISGNPRFREARKSGRAFVIAGQRPSKQTD